MRIFHAAFGPYALNYLILLSPVLFLTFPCFRTFKHSFLHCIYFFLFFYQHSYNVIYVENIANRLHKLVAWHKKVVRPIQHPSVRFIEAFIHSRQFVPFRYRFYYRSTNWHIKIWGHATLCGWVESSSFPIYISCCMSSHQPSPYKIMLCSLVKGSFFLGFIIHGLQRSHYNLKKNIFFF